MLEIRNLKVFYEMPPEEYFSIPAVSFSSLKGFSGEKTAGMMLGSRVHEYIGEAHKYDWADAEKVRKISGEIRRFIGPALPYFKSEVSFICEMHYDGFMMKYKGRIDKWNPQKLIIDWKILGSSLQSAIERFNYDRQMSGYCIATDTPKALIVAFNKKTNKIENKIIIPDDRFWKQQVLINGYPYNI